MMTPLVLLPGLMCDARLFAPQIAAFSGQRMVCTAPMGKAETVSGIADSILAHAPPRFALAGLSMGGIVAMEVIRRAPDRVTRLALMDTNPLAEDDRIATWRDSQIARVGQGLLAQVMRDEMKPHYLVDGPNKADILDLCMTMATDLGEAAFASQSKALQTRPDQSDTLRAVTVPTLILCGAQDRLCPLHRHELMLDLVPGSVLRVIDDAGHLPTLERPDDTTAALATWLNG